MSMRSGRAWRGVLGVLLSLAGLAATPAMAQRHEGAMPDGKGGVSALTAGGRDACGIRNDGEITCWGGPMTWEFPPPRGPFIAVSMGEDAACALRDNGELACWGNPYSPLMQAQVPPYAFTALAVGDFHACALSASSGEAQCWGDGPGQQTPPGGRFVAITAGDQHSCGLRSDGRAECWGANWGGQLDAPAGAFTAISAGLDHSCGLRASGRVECWGGNGNDQAIPPEEHFTAISLGGPRSCGLRADGKVQCWGGGWEPTLTDAEYVALSAGRERTCGIAVDHSVQCWHSSGGPMESPMADVRFGMGSIDAAEWRTCQVRAIDGQLHCLNDASVLPGHFNEAAVGEHFACARNSHGTVQCWGDNSYQQLEIPADPLHGVSLGRAHGCALRSAGGDAACWGSNTNGQTEAPGGPFKGLSAGLVHSCGTSAEGGGACWGYNGDGQTVVPVLAPDRHWLAIQAGDRNSCGLSSDNFVHCWGAGGFDPWTLPTGYFRALSVGNNHACAIRTDGRLVCWGANWSGQSNAPEGTFVAVATGETHSCAIRSSGTRVCWGDRFGVPQLRLDPDRLRPVRPHEWFSTQLSLVDESYPYMSVAGRYALVEGEFPHDVWLDANGYLRGVVHEPGRYTFTLEGRDDNGFAARRQYVLSVDDTPPVVEPVINGTLGENGWYTSEVNLDWSVIEPESEILWSAGCNPVLLSYDTPDAGFTCHAASAGGDTFQEVHIKLDLQAPATHFRDARFEGGQATFEFEGDDQLSGIAGFECSVDNAAFTACASPYTISVQTGTHEFRVRAVDAAGNRDPYGFPMTWTADATPPVINAHVSGTQGLDDWYIGDVQIHLDAHDPDSPMTSMVGCGPLLLDTDSPGASFTCTATSNGGTTVRTVTVKRDATAPVITAAATTEANAAGWYNHDVTVAYSCADATSGVVDCFDQPEQLYGEGLVVAPRRPAHDAAGNSAISNEVTVQIDRTAPTLAPTLQQDVLVLNGITTVDPHGNDTLSGIASASCDALDTGMVGNRSISCTVTDRAGNTASASAAYAVIYGFEGFGAPVQNPATLNLAKSGRSIPLRWRVVDANGAPVSNLEAAFVTSDSIACPVATENRVSEYGGTGGQLQNLGNGYYRLDWQTQSSYRGTCRRMELNLGDGRTHPAQFKFN